MKSNSTSGSEITIIQGFKDSVSIRYIIILFVLSGFSALCNAQDIIKLKSGTEIKVIVIEENNEVLKYKEFENQAGPVYSISRDKVDTIKYKKGGKESKDSKAKEPAKTKEPEILSSGNSSEELTVKKRYVYKDNVKLNSRSVKTIMEDHPEAIRLYESGKAMCDMSNLCAVGVIVTSFTASQIANKQEDDADRRRISAIGLSIDGAFLITAIILSSSGKQKIRKSVSLYNSITGKPVSYNMSIGLQDHGLGIGFMF